MVYLSNNNNSTDNYVFYTVVLLLLEDIYNNKHNVINNGLLCNTLSNRCLERTLDGTAELEHLPSPGSS